MGKKKRITDLKDLKGLNLKKEDKKKDVYSLPYEKSPKPVKEEVTQPAEEEIFMAAMQGVDPINNSKGRQVSPPSRPTIKTALIDLEEQAKKDLRGFIRGDIEFELEYTEEFMYGYVRGLDIKTFQQLKAGSLSIAAHLDLHGMTSDQAYDNLLFFLRESYMQGHRCVLIVTGKGLNSPSGHSILRRKAEDWLTHSPLKRVVLAFCTACPKDGGAGALYVLLRKQKKSQGKMTWDKVHNWEDD